MGKKRHPNAYKSIVMKYNLTNARKKEAVEVAVEYILSQQLQRDWQAEETLGTRNNKPNRNGNKYRNCQQDSNCPICNVSITAILTDGMFVHEPSIKSPPYDYKCWSMRIRYHVAPECAQEELSRGIEPIYKWRWTLRAAEEGYCRMPDHNPPAVGRLLQERSYQSQLRNQLALERPFVPFQKRKETVILLLGLSFLSEPYMALGCLFPESLSNAYARSKQGTRFYENLADITANNGQCTGYEESHIPDFFPSPLHPNITMPTQNFPFCTMDASYMEFVSQRKKQLNPPNGEDFVTTDENGNKITFCFQYTFNVERNVKKGSPLPCNIHSWNDVDVVLSLFTGKDMAMYVERTGWSNLVLENRNRDQQGLPQHTVKFYNVNYIYENVLVQQLKAAYTQANLKMFEREDFLAKYAQCGQGAAAKADIHYRAPGLPDYAAKMWLAFLATGLDAVEDKEFEQISNRTNVGYRQGMKLWL